MVAIRKTKANEEFGPDPSLYLPQGAPEDYEVLDATALGRRLGFKRDTVLAYLSRKNFRRIPRPNRQLAMGPVWYEKSVKEWEAKEESRARGK
jgi:predicted DNA-binding transcriptional regulator AlpA